MIEVTPKKSLGQNFLKNQITINLISDILDIEEAEVESITSSNFFNLFKRVKANNIT